MKYDKQPGYIYDLYFMFFLGYNKEQCLSRFPLKSRRDSDVQFYRSVMEHFAPYSPELYPFFFMKNDTAFMMMKYSRSQSDTCGLGDILKEIGDYPHFRQNVFEFYLDSREDVNTFTLAELSQMLVKTDYPDTLKHRLLNFFIDGERVHALLIKEINEKDKLLKAYYELHTEEIQAVSEELDEDWVCTFMAADDRAYSAERLHSFPYSVSLLNKNAAVLSRMSALVILGFDYEECIRDAQSKRLAPDMLVFAKATADKRRVAILDMLNKTDELTVTDIAQQWRTSITAVYYHMEMMAQAGMLKYRNAGRSVYYSLNRGYFDSMAELLHQYGTMH